MPAFPTPLPPQQQPAAPAAPADPEPFLPPDLQPEQYQMPGRTAGEPSDAHPIVRVGSDDVPLPEALPAVHAHADAETQDPSKVHPDLVGRNTRKTLRGQVVSVIAGKGGVGKSTMSVWLAQTLHACGYSVCLVDGNIAQPDLLKMLKSWSDDKLGLMYLVGEPGHRHTQDDLKEAIVSVAGFVDVLPGPPAPIETDQVEALRALRFAVDDLRSSYDWIVLDTPVATVHEPAMRMVVGPVSDASLIVMTPHRPTIHDTYDWLQAARLPTDRSGLGFELDRAIGVVNQADLDPQVDSKTIHSWLPDLVIRAEIPALPDHMASINVGGWRCPAVAQDGMAMIVHTLTGTSPVADSKAKKKRRGKLFGRKQQEQVTPVADDGG